MKFLTKILSFRHKNNKALYYLRGYLRELTPKILLQKRLQKLLDQENKYDKDYIAFRLNYYNRLESQINLSNAIPPLKELKLPKKLKVYYFDNYEFTRYFNDTLRAKFLIGDVTYIPEEPSITKSRPIHGDVRNSVLLKINKIRHFMFVRDKTNFIDKKNMLVGRSVVRRGQRLKFYEMYFNHPMCDIGQTNKEKNQQWIKKKLTIDEHLQYKFILCIEGNDVASNLKWVMSSNSLAIMPKPTYETWYMEGSLIPNYHYAEIKPDFSDLEDRLNYYINNPEEAGKIIRNANEYVQQFKVKEREDFISLLVLEKYFYRTGQIPYRKQPYYSE